MSVFSEPFDSHSVPGGRYAAYRMIAGELETWLLNYHLDCQGWSTGWKVEFIETLIFHARRDPKMIEGMKFRYKDEPELFEQWQNLKPSSCKKQ